MTGYNLIIDNNHFDMDMVWQVLDIKREMPYVFNERILKLSFYFMYPYSIWSKSVCDKRIVPLENLESDINKLQDNNCSIFFEFENIAIISDHFQDKYSNTVLNVAKGKNAYAVIFNNNLGKYIQKNYPDIKIVQSEMKRSTILEAPCELGVIDYITYQNNLAKLDNKSSYILAVNSFCKNSYRCCNTLSTNKLNFGIERPVDCKDRVRTFDEMTKNNLFVSQNEINRINDSGIEHFFVKANCGDRYEEFETYIYYLFKPEFKDTMRLRLLRNCFMKR